MWCPEALEVLNSIANKEGNEGRQERDALAIFTGEKPQPQPPEPDVEREAA